MSTTAIQVRNLVKTFRVPVREAGVKAAFRSLWSRQYRRVEAVKDISFSVAEGEIVGFLGPNGAGKTTTLKILAGLLYPTSGDVSVAGSVPWKREAAYLRKISMVMGNKSQLLWDIPPLDSLHLIGEIYRVPRADLNVSLDELVDLLDLQPLLTKPVRTLSLGERMKCELAAALIYRPQLLFLDEPTLGLDVTMQGRVRRFIAEYNQRRGATIVLTSHYMADVQALCSRVVMITQGQLMYDGELQVLASKIAPYKIIRVTMQEDIERLDLETHLLPDIRILKHEKLSWNLQVLQSHIPTTTASLLNRFPVVDLAIEEVPIESVIEQVYQGGLVCI